MGMNQQPENFSVDLSQTAVVSPLPSTQPKRRFAVHVAGTLAVRLVMTAGSVVSGVIVARWLGAEGLGTIAVINVTIATAVQLGSMGLPSAGIYFIAKDPSRLAVAATSAMTSGLIVGVIFACALIPYAAWQPDFFNSIPVNLLAIAAISIPFQLLTLIGLNVVLAVGDVERFNLLDLCIQVFVVINALVALIVLRRGLWTLVSLNTAVSVAAGLILSYVVLRLAHRARDGGRLAPKVSMLAAMVRYGMKFHVAIVAGALIVRADLLLVNYFRGTAEAGVYSVASQVALLLMLLPGVIATLLFPRVTAEQDVTGETTLLVSRHAAFMMLLICLIAVPLSFVLPLLYGPAFVDAPIQLLILLPGVFLIGLESVLVQHFNALGMPSAIPLFWIATLAINIVLVLALVPGLGGRGAAVASSASYFLIFVLVAVYFQRKTNRSVAEMFLIRGDELRRLLTIRNWITPARNGLSG